MMNPKYLEIDNIFYSTLIIINYNREHDDLILKDIIKKIQVKGYNSKKSLS